MADHTEAIRKNMNGGPRGGGGSAGPSQPWRGARRGGRGSDPAWSAVRGEPSDKRKNDPQTSSGTRPEEQKKKRRIVSRKNLEDILTRNPRVLVLTLQDPFFGFKELLISPFLKNDMLILTIKALAAAATCNSCHENILALFNDVLSSDVLMRHIPQFLTIAPHDQNFRILLPAILQDLAVIFNKVLLSFPYKAREQLGIALLILKDLIERSKQMGIHLDQELCESFEEIDQRRRGLLETYDSKTREQKVREESEVAQAPPDDFRHMSITPTLSDIHEILEPFLRPNIIEGAFVSLEHYLDVHFRLLREDFIAPLRDGLVSYLSLVSRGKLHELKNKEIKIYHNVQITFPECFLHDGVCQQLRFDVNRLKKVRWEATKRLLHGSLVCLSDNNFASFFLAVVVKRNPVQLKDGIVTVRFVGDVQKAWNIDPNRSFTMIESPAYFEAYSPVLKALQTINADSMPFTQYIISSAKNVSVPRYLLENTAYYITPLLSTEVREKTKQTFKVLDAGAWPTAEDFSLDAAQYAALKAALTREIAIIQGPPGTGKTFLGLKIMEILIRNADIWSEDGNPILVICYTNHALDQFLEGMLKFVPKDIVRVGGRSKCEALSPFNLSYLRRVMTSEKNVPNYIFHQRKSLISDMKQIEEEILKIMSLMKGSESRIIRENLLQNYIRADHYYQLTEDDIYRGKKSTSLIAEWLGLGGANVDQRHGYQEEAGEDMLTNQMDTNEIVDDNDDESHQDDVLAQEEMDRRIEDDDQDESVDNRQKLQKYLEAMERNNELLIPQIAEIMDDEWQVQGGKKRIQKTIRQEMRKTTMMTDQEEKNVNHIMTLPFNDRWRLYRYWVSKIRMDRQQQVRKLLNEYEVKFGQLKEVLREMDVAILQGARVVGMTTTGAAKCRELLQTIAPKIVIVEEAAEVLESHITTALTQHCEHLILIGDQQQLRPNPTVYKLAKDYKLDVSLFERLIKNGLPYERLELQHRMKPNIAALLVPHIYPNLKNHPSVEKYEMIRGINSNLFFVNHDFQETAVADTSSRANEFEANFVVSFCRYLLLQGYEPSQITILSTYLGQLFSIKQKIKNTIGKDVHCTVVDNFQGEENDIILLSLVRSNEEGKIGFLKVDNRVCVALSRARMGLFCFGNFDFLEENSMIWKPIVSYVKRDGLLGRNLNLCCLNHPERMTQVRCAKDFDQVPEGGCNLPCEFRLPCGHQCPKVCHSYDLKHETFKCTKPCPKILCELNHKCPKKCFMECGPCTIQVPKEFSCGHVNMLPCHKNPADTSCKSICKKPLPCGHPCMSLCSDLCSPLSCTVKIQSKSPCGHTVEVACKDQNAENALLSCCSKPCTTLLPCEHPCSGSCCRCNQGRIHQRCKRRCGRTLICGHSCNVPCSQSCPPCRKPCENRCSHSKCPRQCGLPCEPCAEPCVWQCDHYVCTTSCSEFCNRPRCDEPCTKRLPCGHLCIGLCGEPCPHLCRICDKDLVSEIFFGDEDEEDARFVLLEDCQHVIEVNGLDRWMEQGSQCGTDGNDVSIDMKSCPKCKTVIRRNLRYGNVIKRFLNDVIAIKTKIFGDVNVLKVQTRNLEKKVQSLNNNPYCEKNVGHLLSKINADLSSQDIKIYETLNDFLKQLQGLWISAHDQMNTESRFWMKLENRNTIDRLKSRLVQLTSCHLRLDRHSSERELSDFSRELYRINQLMKLLTTIRDLVVSDEAQLIFNRIVENLLSFKPYTEDVEAVVRNDLEEFKKANHGLGVSEAEKIQIVKAIGLAKGHWFKCPNGHFYAIGECGGAMERGKCLECKADIGGQSHTLTSGNTLATEMDGATRPAYPTF